VASNEQLSRGPVPYLTKTDAVYAELRRRILEGVVEPSSTLNQGQLAAELGVSTTPLREAIRRLESEGLVRSVTHRLVVVASLDHDELVWLYEVREELDALAARLAATRHTDAEREQILAALELIANATDGDALSRNRQFHATIYRACHNPVLVELLEALWDRSDRYRRSGDFLARDMGTLGEHRAIAQAVLEGRPDDAGRLMREHLQAAREVFERQIAAGGGGNASEEMTTAVDR
jgi:DNA-binding GntR family transcriptional regulator